MLAYTISASAKAWQALNGGNTVTNRTLVISTILLVLAFPARADRHCGPVVDSYYLARQAALDGSLSCSAAIETVRQRLAEVGTNARICGCTALVSGLESAFANLFEDDTALPRTCQDQLAAVVDDDLDSRIKALVADCH